MSTDRVYKQAIKRVFAEKYHDERMAVYWGREDDMIRVITSLRHYVHKIASENEDTLEFVSSVGDRIVVALPTRNVSRLTLGLTMHVPSLLTAHSTDSGRECCWQNLSIRFQRSKPALGKPCP